MADKADVLGLVSGVECAITVTEATVKGGSVSEIGVQKSARIAEIAGCLPEGGCRALTLPIRPRRRARTFTALTH